MHRGRGGFVRWLYRIGPRRLFGIGLVAAVSLVLTLVVASRIPVSRGVVTRRPISYTYPFGPRPFSPSSIDTTDGEILATDALGDPMDCGTCHPDQRDEWLPSLHARAGDEIIYEAVETIALQDTSFEFVRWCNGCHTPVALLEGRVTPNTIAQKDRMKEGVTCTVCHQVSQIRRPLENASLVLSPEKSQDVPFFRDDHGPTSLGGLLTRMNPSIHARSHRKDLHEDPAFCGPCHREPNHFRGGFLIQDSFTEWEQSPYARKGPDFLTCQDCHMSDGLVKFQPSPGRKSSRSEMLDHVARHRFLGANTVIPALYGDAEQLRLNEEMLRRSAEVTLTGEGRVDGRGETLVEARVTNVGAGHHLPTGVELREMWLELAIEDRDGGEIRRFGEVDRLGNILGDAWRFGTVLADERGQEITDHRIWRAARLISDTRIPAREHRSRVYRLAVPPGVGRIRVRAVLRYRNLSQSLMDLIYRGDGAFKVPITDMASASLELSLDRPPAKAEREPPPPPPRIDAGPSLARTGGWETRGEVLDMAAGPEGTLLLATSAGPGLLRDGTLSGPGEAGLIDPLVTCVTVHEGVVHLLSGHRLFRQDGSVYRAIPTPLDGSLLSLGSGPDGLWLGGVDGLGFLPTGGPYRPAPEGDEALPASEVRWIERLDRTVIRGSWFGLTWSGPGGTGSLRRDRAREAPSCGLAPGPDGLLHLGTASGLRVSARPWTGKDASPALALASGFREPTGNPGPDGPVAAIAGSGELLVVAGDRTVWCRDGSGWSRHDLDPATVPGPVTSVVLVGSTVWIGGKRGVIRLEPDDTTVAATVATTEATAAR